MVKDKQSSIEFLFSEMYNIISFYAGNEQDVLCEKIKEQAKETHKEEIEDAHWYGGQDVPIHESTCEQYYNETFGGNK